MGFSGLRSLITDMEANPSWQARRQFRQVGNYWPKAVGYVVARQTKPVSIQRHILYVDVANASWAQTLTLERRRILHKLNQLLAMPLDDIRFSSAQWHSKPRQAQQPDNDWIRTHPSYVGKLDTDEALEQAPATTPEEAYRGWVSIKKEQQKHQELCPECECFCPSGELARWGMCAPCIVKKWQ
ncbi:DciA family protein [Leptothoe kymatousa]|uniref:DUF721 domain-containing protein n=1 Tax=Leptothoe kymatousa TAU-MAC 1615 TaxID=2364775 RepID=A0ABS5XZ25_9CYAN|nr:DUF721 domain-containing protein [Leptothoe kymatousa]MBT9310808.1 DUF721 domain-containing protein [Leptothoe kymatousa TAU-MAC 1615]